jgi:predicted phage terminase large subunit-like protein
MRSMTDEASRAAGQALHPARESPATLQKIRATIGAANFAGQYQQAPAPARGGLVEAVWFKCYTAAELPARFDQIVQSWDTANKPTELADYSLCTTWGVAGAHLWLLDVMRKKLGYLDLKRAVRAECERHSAAVVLIEDKASGTQLIQELIEASLTRVARCKPDGDKIIRLHAQSATIENGFVHLPAQAPWLADYLQEMTLFPRGRHDDQVDSTAQALAWARRRPPAWGMMDHYRGLSGAGARA